jgi:hypothetical protein
MQHAARDMHHATFIGDADADQPALPMRGASSTHGSFG